MRGTWGRGCGGGRPALGASPALALLGRALPDPRPPGSAQLLSAWGQWGTPGAEPTGHGPQGRHSKRLKSRGFEGPGGELARVTVCSLAAWRTRIQAGGTGPTGAGSGWACSGPPAPTRGSGNPIPAAGPSPQGPSPGCRRAPLQIPEPRQPEGPYPSQPESAHLLGWSAHYLTGRPLGYRGAAVREAPRCLLGLELSSWFQGRYQLPRPGGHISRRASSEPTTTPRRLQYSQTHTGEESRSPPGPLAGKRQDQALVVGGQALADSRGCRDPQAQPAGTVHGCCVSLGKLLTLSALPFPHHTQLTAGPSATGLPRRS
ncbi:collagen alpha-1(XI) chain-like [Hippopotamus amphibius kiboko]|uniref:collagen alpha-1(XI) chain-like n=1 Tax=Hippopotamus amphibius kiboko TaxID=575201 RepID=UPI0025932221|nr:collagen alpha-1(XI) chain-like [Hippopotamus amphibius kiboko]